MAKRAGERVLRGFQGLRPVQLTPKRQRRVGGRLQRLESSGDVVQEARRRRSAARCGRRSGTGRCGGRSRGSGLGGVRGLRAELTRRLAVVGALGSAGNRGGGAPAPTPGGAVARLRAAARVGGGCSGWEVGAGEGQGAFKKGRPASACGSGRRSRRGRCALDWVRSRSEINAGLIRIRDARARCGEGGPAGGLSAVGLGRKGPRRGEAWRGRPSGAGGAEQSISAQGGRKEGGMGR